MKLPDSLVKQFTESTKDTPDAEKRTESYATVVSDGLVRLDGSSVTTPCENTVAVNQGDRVLVKIENHKAVITGNLTSPALDENAVGVVVDGAVGDIAEMAEDAMLSANGKNKVFHRNTAPTTSDGLTAGDIWFDTANDNRINTWTGSAWSAFALGKDAIANASITNAKIANATIQYGKIASLDMGTATTGKLAAQYINVTDLFAQDITATNSFQLDTENCKLTAVGGDKSGFALGVTRATSGEAVYKAGIQVTSDTRITGNHIIVVSGTDFWVYGGDVFIGDDMDNTVTKIQGYSVYLPENVYIKQRHTINSYSLIENAFASSGHDHDSDYSKKLTVASKSVSVSLTANNYSTGNFSISNPGYTPLGIVGYEIAGSRSNFMNLYRHYISGNTYYWAIRNLHTTDTVTDTLTVYVLYVSIY